MAITGYNDKHEFGERLNNVLSPSHPITTIEHLYGRDSELETIQRALFMTGTHIFIHGDRGVGKSSLGATAAYQYQSSDREPIIVGGSVDDTFRTVIANIANRALSRNLLETVKNNTSIGMEWRGVKWSQGQEISTRDIASQIESVSDAVELLKQVSARLGGKPTVVIDEFDMIEDDTERNKFASLLKLLGDQQVNLKFIFTAVGSALDKLLGAHESAYRQLECIPLGRLGWDGRRDIVKKAAKAFGLDIDDNVNWRIAAVSDGFPFYVHEIMSKMLWVAFASNEIVDTLGWDHYYEGLNAAIQGISAELRKPYDKAVLHREDAYEDVVWSTADSEELIRGLPAMYASYEKIIEQRPGREKMDSKRYAEYVRKLKSPAFGQVVEQITGRPGWYTYRAKMLRGFVRMQAEANGVDLHSEAKIPKQKMYVPFNAKVGYRGPSVPRGVKLARERSEEIE